MPVATNGRMQTGPQTVLLTRTWVDDERARLAKKMPATYQTYRKMRVQPTIALARALTIAPVIGAEWTIEADEDVPEEWIQFIRDEMMPIREPLVTEIMQDRVDYGWSPYELVWQSKRVNGVERLAIRRYKPLLPDLTEIVVEQETGLYAGLYQYNNEAKDTEVTLDREYTLLIAFEVEGTDYYGRPLLENIRPTYIDWMEANDGAARYDKKVAGDHWIVQYPEGTTPVDGEEKSNALIAQELLDTLESSGSAAIPVAVRTRLDEINAMSEANWSIDIKQSSAQQGNFVTRMDYCDKLFVRGMLAPERTILEGQYGTKAEAGVHSDWSLQQREIEHRHLTRQINWYIVNRLLVFNFGPEAENKVRLVVSPLNAEQLAFYRSLYTQILTNPVGFIDAMDALDFDALVDAIDLPKSQAIADDIGPDGEARTGVDVPAQLVQQMQELAAIANAPQAEATSGATA